jgi:hypothetical protein
MFEPVREVKSLRGNPIRSHPSASAGGVVSEGGGSYPDSTVRITDQYSSISQLYGQSIFTSKGHIYGSAEKKTNGECGKIRSVRLCSKDQDHDLQKRHICCNEPTCPVCYPKFSHRLAEGIVERVKGYQVVYPNDLFSHLIMSPPPATSYQNMKEAFGQFTKMFMKYGGKAASVVYHPYRIKNDLKTKLHYYQDGWLALHKDQRYAPDFWKLAHEDVLGIGPLKEYVDYGPHFHAIATGYLENSESFHKKTGWIYKKVKSKNGLDTGDITRVAHYESTHTAWEWGKHSVRYVGAMSYAKLGRTKEGVRREQVKCKVCGAAVHEHAWMGLTEEIGDCIKTEVEERIILWKYWKRGKKERKKKQTKDDASTTGYSEREIVGYSDLIGR